jgi:hypothetical protein
MSDKQQLIESLSPEDIQRFWDTPCTVHPTLGCQLWGDQSHINGVSGHFNVHGHRVAVHRLAYFLYHGSIPSSGRVQHTCPHKHCIAREHLVRLPRPPQPKPHPQTRISDALAKEIHAALAGKTKTKEIAQKFGVRISTVREIKRGVGRWAALFPAIVKPDPET